MFPLGFTKVKPSQSEFATPAPPITSPTPRNPAQQQPHPRRSRTCQISATNLLSARPYEELETNVDEKSINYQALTWRMKVRGFETLKS